MSTLMLGKGMIAVELAGLGGGFWIFHKINTDVEARRKMHTVAPFVIEAFAKTAGVCFTNGLGLLIGVIFRQDCS
jgi:hypothetical protein